jgi:hypothetical protein
MASRNVQCRVRTKTPCKLLASRQSAATPTPRRLPRNHGDLGTEWVPEVAYSALARRLCTMRGLRASPQCSSFALLAGFRPDARWHGHAGARRAGARRRMAKTGRWLRPIRLGIGASNCATRSAPSSNSCAGPSRSCALNSIRRTRRSGAAASAIRTQARHSGSSPKPGHGAAVAFGPRCENVSCCKSQRTRRGGARSAARRVGKWSRVARFSCPRLERQLDAIRLGAERSLVQSSRPDSTEPLLFRRFCGSSRSRAAAYVDEGNTPRRRECESRSTRTARRRSRRRSEAAPLPSRDDHDVGARPATGVR